MGNFLLGIILGLALSSLISALRSTFGTLQIDHSNPEKDVYRIHIDNLDIPRRKTHVVLAIDHDADLSQE